jgi:hypothetical protein
MISFMAHIVLCVLANSAGYWSRQARIEIGHADYGLKPGYKDGTVELPGGASNAHAKTLVEPSLPLFDGVALRDPIGVEISRKTKHLRMRKAQLSQRC